MTNSAFNKQIVNRNFLSPVGFKFTLAKNPKVAFFCNSAKIPEISLATEPQPSYLKNIDVPGDKIDYEDFTLRFLVDENMENYMEIHNWMRGLGYPESLQEIYDLKEDAEYNPNTVKNSDIQYYSDGTLQILNSNQLPRFNVKFYNMFPVSLSTLTFDATQTDINYFTAQVTFKYTIFDIEDMFGDRV